MWFFIIRYKKVWYVWKFILQLLLRISSTINSLTNQSLAILTTHCFLSNTYWFLLVSEYSKRFAIRHWRHYILNTLLNSVFLINNNVPTQQCGVLSMVIYFCTMSMAFTTRPHLHWDFTYNRLQWFWNN